jgi:hypothetical protein
MIQIIFEFLGDMELVIVDGNNVLFGNTSFGAKLATIDGLKLDYSGVIREFPDLELEADWREIAMERFKNKIKKQSTEKETALYIIDELKKFGHNPIKIQLSGSRWRKIDDHQ